MPCPICESADIMTRNHHNAKHFDELVAQHGAAICWDCSDARPYLGGLPAPSPCPDCEAGKRGVKITDETTGRQVMDWCPTCEGRAT